jgi:FKBP-type peptidyl-prolyl cis-trans isomerase (trigger factor)
MSDQPTIPSTMPEAPSIIKTMSPMPKQVHVRVSMSISDVEKRLNEYWESVKDRLDPSLEKKASRGYRNVQQSRVVLAAGGETKFYKTVWLELMTEAFDEIYNEVMTFVQYAVKRDDATNQYLMEGAAFLEPQVSLELDKIKEEAALPPLNDEVIAQTVTAKLEDLRDQNSVLIPKEGVAELGDAAVATANSLIDGEQWLPGCFSNQKIQLKHPGIKLKSILEAMLGHKTGDTINFTGVFDDSFEPEVVGKTVTGTIKIVQLYTKEVPELNDDLAKDAGFETFAQMKRTVEREVENHIAALREQQCWGMFLMNVLRAAKVDPIPEPWLQAKAEEAYDINRAKHKTEKDFLFAARAIDKDHLLQSYREQIQLDFVQHLAVRKYAFETKTVEPSRLSNIWKAVAESRAKILRRMKIDMGESKE